MANWIAKNKHQCAKKDHVNYLTPLAIYPDMYLRTKEPYYRETAVEYADWVMANAGRSRDGVFFHGASVSDEVWADTVFMASGVLVAHGETHGKYHNSRTSCQTIAFTSATPAG